VSLPERILLPGTDGGIEVVQNRTLIVRRPGQAEQLFEFPAPDGDLHDPGLVPSLTQVTDAVRAGRQLSPSFDDSLAAAEVMDEMRRRFLWREDTDVA
jgi:hypothetical protein